MEKGIFALKGTFLDSASPDALRVREGYAVCRDGLLDDIYPELPQEYAEIPVRDLSGCLILPGMTDLHLHACQYAYVGTAMDLELLQWLNEYTFPEESRYADVSYAERAYTAFADELLHTATTRACIFGSIHADAALVLMSKLEERGLPCFVGKTAMDRCSPDFYTEGSAENGMCETLRWLEECRKADFRLERPMLTPRFTPSCTDEYMRAMGELAVREGLPVQSHLDENTDEIAWVKELCPDSKDYLDTYERFNLAGKTPAVMAHCIYCTPEEDARLKAENIMIAHCPTSNENVIAGIAPAARYLREGYRIGLGSDIAGGHTLNLLEVMRAAVEVSKLRYRLKDASQKPLSLAEAFWMATAGGGAFFGKAGRFEKGYLFDACAFDDSALCRLRSFGAQERLERLAYLSDGKPCAKYAEGRRLF